MPTVLQLFCECCGLDFKVAPTTAVAVKCPDCKATVTIDIPVLEAVEEDPDIVEVDVVEMPRKPKKPPKPPKLVARGTNGWIELRGSELIIFEQPSISGVLHQWRSIRSNKSRVHVMALGYVYFESSSVISPGYIQLTLKYQDARPVADDNGLPENEYMIRFTHSHLDEFCRLREMIEIRRLEFQAKRELS